MARSGDRGVFFGWEKRRGLFRASRARTRQVAVGVVVLGLAVLVFRREERAAGVHSAAQAPRSTSLPSPRQQ